MDSRAAAEPDQTRENDSRWTANSQATHRTRAERNIGQIRIAANRQRRVVAGRKSKAGLIEPVPDQGFQMLAAADAPRVFLRCQRGMPGENLEAV